MTRMRGSVKTTRRSSVIRAAIGVLGHRSSKVEGRKAQTGLRLRMMYRVVSNRMTECKIDNDVRLPAITCAVEHTNAHRGTSSRGDRDDDETVVSGKVAEMGPFHELTSWVPCYPGLLVPPWGLLTPLASHLDGEMVDM
jgi:hypothetical protein